MSSRDEIAAHASWPPEDLERVDRCPVCGDARARLLTDHATDNVFFCSPGTWKIWKCQRCQSAYLNPRPSRASIHRAYQGYYTHRDPRIEENYASLSSWRRLRRRLLNGYTNARFGTSQSPSSKLGRAAMLLMSRRKAHVDLQFRHLPQPFGSRALLDIGCGNGSFVRLAQSCGWSAVGIDPDPQAVQGAASEGLSVFCGDLQVFEGKQEVFDVITMNHVIEHVHEPLDVLRRCHELLRPGGQLWVDTPNIESLGFSLFRENWRGIEAPRHLVLFNRQSLADSLRLVGFAEVRSRSRPDPAPATFRMSDAIRRGRGQDTSESVPLSVRMQIAASAVCSVVAPARREFLTFTAMKA